MSEQNNVAKQLAQPLKQNLVYKVQDKRLDCSNASKR